MNIVYTINITRHHIFGRRYGSWHCFGKY